MNIYKYGSDQGWSCKNSTGSQEFDAHPVSMYLEFSCGHGRNLVGDGGNIICHVPPLFSL